MDIRFRGLMQMLQPKPQANQNANIPLTFSGNHVMSNFESADHFYRAKDRENDRYSMPTGASDT